MDGEPRPSSCISARSMMRSSWPRVYRPRSTRRHGEKLIAGVNTRGLENLSRWEVEELPQILPLTDKTDAKKIPHLVCIYFRGGSCDLWSSLRQSGSRPVERAYRTASGGDDSRDLVAAPERSLWSQDEPQSSARSFGCRGRKRPLPGEVRNLPRL